MLLRSIRTRILGLVVATVVPFCGLIGVAIWKQWRDGQAAAIQRSIVEARLLAAQVDDHVGNLENLLVGLSRAVSWKSEDKRSNDTLLRDAKADLPRFISNILVFALDGANIGISSSRSETRPRA